MNQYIKLLEDIIQMAPIPIASVRRISVKNNTCQSGNDGGVG